MTKISERLIINLCSTCLVFFACTATLLGSPTPSDPSEISARTQTQRASGDLPSAPAPLKIEELRNGLTNASLSRLAQTPPGSSLQITGTPPRNTVGVIIPLTGKWESIGQKILKGIEMAANVFTDGPTPDVEYLIRDYGNNEDSIPKIIEELDREHGVIAVIGPVGERAGDIACREALVRRLPAIILTQAEKPPQEGTYCFRNFLTIDIQAKTLLSAARSMGISRFAIMNPDDFFGKTFSHAFQRMAPSFGITVVRTITYSPQNVDFKEPVKSLLASSRKASSPALKSKGKGPDFEALLIPDAAANAAMIASYISYLNIPNIRLFGPTLWDTPDLVHVGGRYVENAVFLSGFFPGSLLSAVQNFNRTFTETFKYPPSVWEASAFDSATILQGLLQSHGLSRQGLKERISTLKDFHGVSGTTSFNSTGSLDKMPYILTIKGGTVFEIHP